MKRLVSLAALLLSVSGCALKLTPEMIEALGKDPASFCLSSGVSGGAGGAGFGMGVVGSGGYGQGTLNFCRTNQPNSQVELKADGSISITHGK